MKDIDLVATFCDRYIWMNFTTCKDGDLVVTPVSDFKGFRNHNPDRIFNLSSRIIPEKYSGEDKNRILNISPEYSEYLKISSAGLVSEEYIFISITVDLPDDEPNSVRRDHFFLVSDELAAVIFNKFTYLINEEGCLSEEIIERLYDKFNDNIKLIIELKGLRNREY